MSEQDQQHQQFYSLMPGPVPGHPRPIGPVVLPVIKRPVVAANPVRNADGQPVPDLYEFHCREKMTTWINEGAFANSNCDEREEGEQYSPITRMVINIDGVAEIRLEPYKMVVRKAVLYHWEELAPKILMILKCWHDARRGMTDNRVIVPGEQPSEAPRDIMKLPPGTTLRELGLLGGASERFTDDDQR